MTIKLIFEPANWFIGFFHKPGMVCIFPLPCCGIAIRSGPSKEEIAVNVADRIAPRDTLDLIIEELKRLDAQIERLDPTTGKKIQP